MATRSVTHAAAGYVSQSAMGVRGLYSEKRKYSKSDVIVWAERVNNVFDNILRQESQVVTVDDPEPRLFTAEEAPTRIDVKTDSANGTATEDAVYISDTTAKYLQAGDILMVNQIFCESDGTLYTTTKYDQLAPETIIVNSVSLSGAASGVADIRVARGNGYAAGTPINIASEYKLVWMGNCNEEGWSAPTAVWHEPSYVDNYIQNFAVTWEETETETNTNVYAKQTMNDKAKQNRERFFRRIDFSGLFGRKGKDIRNGQERRRTGGVVEFVPAAAGALDGVTRKINFNGAFELSTLRENCETIFNYGSDSKILFGGFKFFTAFWNKMEKYVIANDSLSKKWGWAVYDLDMGHGLLHCMRHPIFRDMDTSAQRWGYDAVIVDPKYWWLMKMKNMDVKVKYGVEDNDEHTKKAELYGALGWKRALPSAHAVIHGITS